MRLLLLSLFLTSCTWTPRRIEYPDGSAIMQVDQYTLDQICTHTSDEGVYIKHAAGCYDKANKVIYVRYDCEGAKALTHEWAHRYGVTNPTLDGYDW